MRPAIPYIGRFASRMNGLRVATLAAAEECERILARRQYRLRRYILNLQAYRDHLVELGDALRDWRAA